MKNKIKKNSIIIFILTIIILYIVLKDNFKETLINLSIMNKYLIIISILIYFLYVIIGGYITYITLNDKKRLTLKEAIKHNFITQFFNGITPFSTGGQPMQIYMLKEHKVSIAEATSITITDFILYQVALVLYGIIAVIINYKFKVFPKNEHLSYLVLLGFIINTCVAICLFLITFFPNISKITLDLILKLLTKLKLIKNYTKTKDKLYKKIDEFYIGSKKLRQDKVLLIKGIMLNFLSLTCLYIVPFFIIISLNQDISIINTIISSAYVQVLGSFVPIPGASGGIEYGYYKFFGNFVENKTLGSTLIVYRFITYYLGMLIGGLIFSLEKKKQD